MPDVGLLTPGLGDADPDDVRFVRALVVAESAWVRACASAAGTHPDLSSVDACVDRLVGSDDAAARFAATLARGSGATGNPVIDLVAAMREGVAPELADAVHAHLTSQDVMDTALVMVLRDAAHATRVQLAAAGAAATRLVEAHADTPALARTLSQAALPTTLGARFATWLHAIAQAERLLSAAAADLPVSFGGAAGTLAGAPPHAATAIRRWAGELRLAAPALPWHTTRYPVLRISSALAEACAALGTVAANVLAATRPEAGELREHHEPGKGASSAMPFKANPVLSIQIKRSAIVAPHQLAQVYAAAGLAVDERPDGAWHAEWPAARELARHAVASSRAAAALLGGLEVDTAAVARNLAAHGPEDADTGHAAEFARRTVADYGFTGGGA